MIAALIDSLNKEINNYACTASNASRMRMVDRAMRRRANLPIRSFQSVPDGDELPRILEDREPVQSLGRTPHALSQRYFTDKEIGGSVERVDGILAVARVIAAIAGGRSLQQDLRDRNGHALDASGG